MFRRLIATDADWTTRIASLMLGIVFFPHGAQKMLGWFGGPGFAGEMEILTASPACPPSSPSSSSSASSSAPWG